MLTFFLCVCVCVFRDIYCGYRVPLTCVLRGKYLAVVLLIYTRYIHGYSVEHTCCVDVGCAPTSRVVQYLVHILLLCSDEIAISPLEIILYDSIQYRVY